MFETKETKGESVSQCESVQVQDSTRYKVQGLDPNNSDHVVLMKRSSRCTQIQIKRFKQELSSVFSHLDEPVSSVVESVRS